MKMKIFQPLELLIKMKPKIYLKIMVKQLFSTLEVIKREFINSYKDLDSMRVSFLTLSILVDAILIRLNKLGIFGQMRSLAKQ